ncbi:unnamed protein product, partial [Vitis vinifera]
MARGPAALLSRIRSSKHDVSRFRVFPSKRCIHSFGEWRNPTASAFDLSKPAFFTSLMNLVHLQSASGSPNLRDFRNSIGARHFSSMREDGDGDENTVPGLTIEDGDDVSSISDSTMVENGDEGKSNCDSSMVESGNSSDDVGSGESVGYEHVAYRDPAELYRELCDSQTSAKPTKSDWEMVSEILHHFRKSVPGLTWSRSMIKSADLTKPHTWFPFARAMKRKIIYHCGPTNSGKTYNALQRYMEAKKGIYCSPLRLLAMEVFDKVNALGIYCSLHTGQEKKNVPFSNHTSCTVEMVSTDDIYDVAVIDEIQMMSDPCRGYAWTRALLGLKADEIHLCGDPSVLNVVRKICSETGDELFEQHYERFKPLVVEAKTLLGELQNVRSGDCVVAFSRREIFEVKLAIEKHTNHRCCVIYGALPPETRRQQASLFNDPDNEYDVLVASDAVGMGLNLNIRRVVFYSLSKYNGDKIFSENCQLDGSYFLCRHDHIKKVANMLQKETFPYVKKAETMATGIADLLGQSLSKACWKPESRQAGKPKPQQKEDGYERPRSLVKLFDERRHEKSPEHEKFPQHEHSEKVAA